MAGKAYTMQQRGFCWKEAKADTIQEINQQLGIIDEKIEKGESFD